MQFSARGHTRHAANIAVIKRYRSLGEPLKIWGMNPIATIGGQHVAIERIEHHENGFHPETAFAGKDDEWFNSNLSSE
jgi:hypothetical protein